jgi:hypothetical protein
MNFDYSKINTEDASDPLLQGSESNIFMVYANFGLQLLTEIFWRSFS